MSTDLDTLVAPTVFVLGAIADVAPLFPPGTRAFSCAPDDLHPEPTPIALVVLDARVHSLHALAAARRSPRLARVPALLIVSGDGGADAALLSVGADDVLAAPFGGAAASRRVHNLVELGRTRFAMWFAHQALEHSVSGLTIADLSLPDTPLVHATSVFEKITGYPVAEVRGQNCRFLQGPATGESERAELGAAVRARREARATVVNYRKDGTPFWNEVTVFPVRTPDGQLLRWVGGVQHDVTSLVEARAEATRLFTLLLERQTFDQAILDGVDVGIVTADAGGRVTFVNRCAREVLAVTAAVDGHDVQRLLRLRSAPDALLGRLRERRWTHSLHVDGREIELELTVSRAAQASSEHLGFFFIFHDRTHDKQVEMEHRRFERLAAMGTMVAGFAHEVRNPMASLRSIAESLNEELAEANVRLPHVDRMLKVLERVERLVRTSLLFGRPAPPRPAAHRPWTLLSAGVSSLLPRTRLLGGELGIEADPDLPDVFVDDGQIVQVLVILLNNAIDATGSPRRVVLRALHGRAIAESRARKSDPPPPPFVRLEVKDDGPGIPPDIMGRIFDPFFTTKPSGTGLGLSIAQQLVTENGGRIELTSSVGGPTTFSVLLPVVGVAPADLAPLSAR